MSSMGRALPFPHKVTMSELFWIQWSEKGLVPVVDACTAQIKPEGNGLCVISRSQLGLFFSFTPCHLWLWPFKVVLGHSVNFWRILSYGVHLTLQFYLEYFVLILCSVTFLLYHFQNSKVILSTKSLFFWLFSFFSTNPCALWPITANGREIFCTWQKDCNWLINHTKKFVCCFSFSGTK